VSGTAGASIIGADFITNEQGDTATFSISLNSAPARDVTIAFTSSDTTEGVLTNPILTFTSANWSTPQAFTVAGQNDSLVDGDIAYTISAKITTLDVNYKSVTVNTITLTNQDTPIAKVETIAGTDGNDILRGTDAPSYMLGKAGDDDMAGGAGNDTLWGSYGDDVMSGNDGNDIVYGEQNEPTHPVRAWRGLAIICLW
jgi:Ca2+-binding RTX toxin-like protein